MPALLLLLAEILLLLFFPPSLIFDPTVTAGGDTPSHFIAAIAMQNKLLSPFSPVTWFNGAYAGFPLFLHYFPLPFYLMALISFAVPIQVAFKLVTLLAVIPLPAAVYFCLRRLGYRDVTPALGAVLSIAFLFMTENSMWGGNIPSTLAGEFSFGMSFILYIIYIGRLYADVPGKRSLFKNSVLESLIALSSGYPILQAGAGTSYFILRGGNLRYILCLHAAAFGLAGFWLLPLLWRVPWNTPFMHSWQFQGWAEILPPVLWPAIAGAVVGLGTGIAGRFRRGGSLLSVLKGSNTGTELYLWWQFGIALLGFGIAPLIGLVDIRFLPFVQIMLVLLGAIGWGKLLARFPLPSLWALGFSAGVVALALTKASAIDSWIQWNYSGMESKPLWTSFYQVNEFLRGDENSPRVVYEHADIHNGAGTVRAFEMLPCFSGRSTLEGLYMQSSASSPFVFYIQSELSQTPSCPYSDFYYSRPDSDRAVAHMRLFNVSQLIAASDNLANTLDASPDFELQMFFPPYKVYRLKSSGNSYVTPVSCKPFRIPPSNWKQVQYEWFRKSSMKVPLVVASENTPGDFWRTLPIYDTLPENIPEIPILDPGKEAIRTHAVLGEDRITINTSQPGHPLWIKVSYHPDWRISEGEGELYQASPAFMLLLPKSQRVVLSFDVHSGIYTWGKVLSLITLLLFGLMALIGLRRGYRHEASNNSTTETPGAASRVFPVNAVFLLTAIVMAALILAAISMRNYRDPILLYNQATSKYAELNQIMGDAAPETPTPGQASKIASLRRDSAILFEECITRFGSSTVLDHSMYHKALLMMGESRWSEVRSMLSEFLKDNPDNRIQAESLLFIGEASLNMAEDSEADRYFRQVLLCWPESGATRSAGLHLARMHGAKPLLDSADGLFSSGRYIEAYTILRSLLFSQEPETRGRSMLLLAYCCYHMNRWEEASNLFSQWLGDHFDDPESLEAQAMLKRCRTIVTQSMTWQTGGESAWPPAPQPGWLLRLFGSRS
ncbi:MAG: 6-pyruvoyl-tetrahydropterin synthase-related protein [Syntrophobacteraceae bacterium]